MKRCAAALILFAAVLYSAAADSVIGLRGIFAMNLGSKWKDSPSGIFAPDLNLNLSEEKLLLGGGGALYAGFDLISVLGLQVEGSILVNNGMKAAGGQVLYSTLDVPVYLTVRVDAGPFQFTALAGPNFSFPFGSLKASGNGSGTYEIASSFLVGLAAGADFGLEAGPGSLVLGARYINDFMPVKARINDSDKTLFYRRALTFSLGYELEF